MIITNNILGLMSEKCADNNNKNIIIMRTKIYVWNKYNTSYYHILYNFCSSSECSHIQYNCYVSLLWYTVWWKYMFDIGGISMKFVRAVLYCPHTIILFLSSYIVPNQSYCPIINLIFNFIFISIYLYTSYYIPI